MLPKRVLELIENTMRNRLVFACAFYICRMDIQRPDIKKKKQQRQWIVGGVWHSLYWRLQRSLISRLKPAAPTVDRATVWTDTVKQGPLLRQVRGPGTLVPREDRIRLIPAETEATVVSIRVLPGAKVEPTRC